MAVVGFGNGGTISYSSPTFTAAITAAIGSDVFLAILAGADAAAPAPVLDGTAMELVGSYKVNGWVWLYRAAGAGTGAPQTITGSIASGVYYAAFPFSATGVGSIGDVTYTSGSANTMSSGPITVNPGELAVGLLGIAYTGRAGTLKNVTGGISRFLNNASPSVTSCGLAVQTSDQSVTFAADGYTNGTGPTAVVTLTAILKPAQDIAVTPAGGVLTIIGETLEIAAGVTTPVGFVASPRPAGLVIAGNTLAVRVSQKPFYGLIAKLAADQPGSIQVIGDSTAYGSLDGENRHGWVGRLATLIGVGLNVDVGYREFSPSNTLYSSAEVLHQGASPGQLTVFNGSVPGSNLSNLSYYTTENNLLAWTTPDVVLIADGFNDVIAGGSYASNYVANMQSFIDLVKSTYPGVPIVVTTENKSQDVYPTTLFEPYFSAMTTALVGSATPLTPALKASTGTADVWTLDTQQAYPDDATKLATLLDFSVPTSAGLHPNAVGYATQAQWMFEQLAPGIAILNPRTAAAALIGENTDVEISDHIVIAPRDAQLELASGQLIVDAIGDITANPAASALALRGHQAIARASDRIAITPRDGRLTVAPGQAVIDTSDGFTCRPSAAELIIVGGMPTLAITEHIRVNPGSGQLVLTGDSQWAGDPNIKAAPRGAMLAIAGGRPAIIIRPLASPPPETRTVRAPARNRIVIATR